MPQFIYDETGKITGYKSPGGADTVFPFSRGLYKTTVNIPYTITHTPDSSSGGNYYSWYADFPVDLYGDYDCIWVITTKYGSITYSYSLYQWDPATKKLYSLGTESEYTDSPNKKYRYTFSTGTSVGPDVSKLYIANN